MLVYNSKKLFIILIFDVCCLLPSTIYHLPSAFAVTHQESLEWLLLQENYEALAARAEDLAGTYLDARYLYLSGLGYLKNSNYSQARGQWEKLLQQYPKSEECLKAEIRIADSYYLEGEGEEALNRYLTIHKKRPGSPWQPYILFRLGQCYQRIGNRQETKWYFQQITREYPDSPEAKWTKIQLEEGILFSVQVGAFSSKGNAYRMKRFLADKGFRSHIAETQAQEKTLYRVRVGKLASHQEARELEARLQKEGFSTKIYP